MKITAAPTTKSCPTLADIAVGECFIIGYITYMRIVPAKTLVRSTMVHEVLTRGDCFAVNMSNGQFTIFKFSTPVLPIDSALTITSKQL